MVDGGGLLSHTTPRRVWPGLEATARRLVLRAGALGGGAIEVYEAGRTHRLGRGDPVARVEVHDARTYEALLRAGSVGLGSAYVAGWWDADDLTAFLRALFTRMQPLLEGLDRLGRTVGSVLDVPARLAAPSRSDDRRNIRAHYDVSNEFFELMLDDTMTYSCGLFERPDSTLHDAQVRKIDRLCSKLDLRPGDRLVEIGSGWGGFAIHAAEHYGSLVTTTTVSEAQRGYVEKRVGAAGLADRVTVLGDDWRDLRGRFDKLVSVEMIEAVDWRHHDDFLAACAALLTGGGLAALQAIVIDDRSFERAKRHHDFIRAMVFPGGCLPSVASITASLAVGHGPFRRRPRGHRVPLRRDAETLGGEPRLARARAPAPRGRNRVPPAMDPLPRVLRDRLPGTPCERRADRAREAVLARPAGGSGRLS